VYLLCVWQKIVTWEYVYRRTCRRTHAKIMMIMPTGTEELAQVCSGFVLDEKFRTQIEFCQVYKSYKEMPCISTRDLLKIFGFFQSN